MQGEPAKPSSPPEDDPDHVATRLREQMIRVKRWFAWERWLMEPRSFDPPEDQPDDDQDGDA